MSNPTYYLTTTGNGYSPDGTLPPGAVACTQEQHANAGAWTIENGEIVAYTMPLAEAQAVQSAVIKTACRNAILGGFSSSALGADYAYPSDDVAQRNIGMCAVGGGLLWCETGATWAMVVHTTAQAQQVQKDLFAMIQTNQAKYETLMGEIAAATSVAAVQAITW